VSTPNLLERLTKPQRLDLPVVRGDSVYFVITLKDRGKRVPLDGKVGRAAIREAFDYPVVTELTVTVDESTTGPTVGDITVEATGQQTQTFPQFGVWDLQISDGSIDGTFRKTLVQGTIKFVRDVTPNT